LFYGPPGTGKTYVARAIAKQAKSNLIIVSSGTLLTKFQGSGAESLLKILSFAKNNSPCILFFDEVDAIGDKKATEPERANMRQTLQMEMTNPNKPGEEIAFMAATNYPSNLEDAIKNRFTIQCPLFNPNYLGRIQLLSNNIKKTAPASADLNKIIAQLNSCTFLKEMRREDSKSFDDITIKFLTPVAARNLAPLGLSVGEKLSEAGEPIQYFKIPKLLSDLINKSPDTWILDEQKIKTREADLHAQALKDLDGSLGLSEYELFKENLREAGELGNMNSEKDLLIVVPSISEEVQKKRSKAFDKIADKYKDMPAYVFIRDLASGESTVDSKLDVFKKFASELIKQLELSKWLKPENTNSPIGLVKDKADLARRSSINICDDYNKARLSVFKKHSNLEKKLSAEQKKSKPKSDTKPKQKAKKSSHADKKEIMHKSVLEILKRRSTIQ
jgi:DNA polymerase III gamma/tau subunit